MNGLSPYIAAGFAAALALTSLQSSLTGSTPGIGSLGQQVTGIPQYPAVAASPKGDRLKSPPAAEQTRMVSTVELVGLREVTAVLLRDAAGQVVYRNDPISGVTVVTKGVVLPQVTIREADQASPRTAPAEPVRQPSMLPEACDPAVSSLEAVSASDFGVRCFAAREENLKVARVL